eukprot:CAMPEP_0206324492 /NCGR_PEP_ID=MMETSP0106_2-20121207/20543_1 /ASSEMBLY_ACC=CAM_ASM_000206 /TAXON_ID=81532 /ORGANISM="Acanthoeca-like sp., Strain 10tr" /LENGTH=39 /DNA_ID= /DNA_START= /DNA_END= /DNA_ORIENTATION=
MTVAFVSAASRASEAVIMRIGLASEATAGCALKGRPVFT